MATETSTKLTYEDYVNLPNDGKRYEIIDGELYVNPAPNIKHQKVAAKLFYELYSFVKPRKLGEVFFAPCDVVLSEIDTLQPDILFVSAARMEIITRANVKGAPDLVIEVLSEGTRNYDETIKKKRYERFAVSEYWIVDIDDDSVRVHRRVGTRFELVDAVATITTPLLPGFTLAVHEIFAD
ncbi:MAG TPA: Uma2 family endonuclease [Thermoanaerobaculia bacterium]|nr:Uma2 family endonuclease [Thermoanaerobaculia bacterium]